MSVLLKVLLKLSVLLSVFLIMSQYDDIFNVWIIFAQLEQKTNTIT